MAGKRYEGYGGACSFEGCVNLAQSRNEPLCRSHVMQFRRGGELRPLRERQVRTDDGRRYRCSICKEARPASAFGWDTARNEPKRQCRPCLAEYTRQWNKDHPEAVRRSILKRKGITPEEFDALMAAQDARCAICRCEPRDYRSFAVDHDHGTNGNRGLLCQDCNMGLGQFKDDPEVLDAAASYLRAHRS